MNRFGTCLRKGLWVHLSLMIIIMLNTACTSPQRPTPVVQFYLPTVMKPCVANCYYVDSANGSDANPGNSIDKPWRTLAPVNVQKFLPGDVVHFKRGSSWTGGLVINDSGTQDHPITFTTYGSGDRPVFRNPGSPDSLTRSVVINADWVIVEGLLARDAAEAGIYISPNADHDVVQDNEVTNVGFGVAIHGQYNLVTRNFVHDLHMVRNTPGGDDDYGAVGVDLEYGSNNEISYNKLVNCIAPSYDYGTDGGAVEFWGNADGNYVHHNWATGDNGFLEVGGGSARDNRVAYNVSVNNGVFSVIHLSGPFTSDVKNFRLENNTIVETAKPGWVVFTFEGTPSNETFLLRNNIIYIEGFKKISDMSSFTHDHNLYYLSGGTELGYSLGQGEMIADPLFVNRVGEDYHLMSTSPAIDSGNNLGYTLDFDGHTVPYGIAPDMGAFEYQGPP